VYQENGYSSSSLILYAKEELMWYQKAHEKWLLEGDQNISYLHRAANGRKRKNTMFSLKIMKLSLRGLVILLLMQPLSINLFLDLPLEII
jgi:hypothetical protein